MNHQPLNKLKMNARDFINVTINNIDYEMLTITDGGGVDFKQLFDSINERNFQRVMISIEGYLSLIPLDIPLIDYQIKLYSLDVNFVNDLLHTLEGSSSHITCTPDNLKLMEIAAGSTHSFTFKLCYDLSIIYFPNERVVVKALSFDAIELIKPFFKFNVKFIILCGLKPLMDKIINSILGVNCNFQLQYNSKDCTSVLKLKRQVLAMLQCKVKRLAVNCHLQKLPLELMMLVGGMLESTI